MHDSPFWNHARINLINPVQIHKISSLNFPFRIRCPHCGKFRSQAWKPEPSHDDTVLVSGQRISL